MRILFMGTPDFAKESLEQIYNKGYEIIGVVTNPDKPKGRGMKMIPTPVKEFALEKGLDIYQPIRVRENTEFIEKIKSLEPDIICVVAYGKILPKEILDIPKFGCINVHGSLLPKYRGAAPIQWAIINGEKVTGITTMFMDIEMDSGDMILKEEVNIGDDETLGELWDRLSKIGGKLLVETIELIKTGKANRTKQSDEYTLAPMIDKKISEINWKNEALGIKNLIRGLDPIMGTYSYLGEKKFKIWKSKISELKDSNYEPGTIIKVDNKTGIHVQTGKGVLNVLEIQAENSKRMSIQDFLRGNSINEGSKFESK